MKKPLKTLLFLSALLTCGLSARAEVAVTVDHNEDTAAADAFKFKTVPSPHPSAARSAVFKVLDGTPDDNSATIDVLHDGKLPEEDDQPDANFFFQEDSDGGRFLVDLGKVIPIKEVDTYSRHPSTRAPQVYKLYGSDGAAAGFVTEPKRPQDPAEGGWKLLATVDTRKQFGSAGGQYGVKVTDPAGPLGSYRYLLFEVSRTEDEDGYGNTFFSEIDVTDATEGKLDADKTPASKEAAAAPLAHDKDKDKVTVTMEHNEDAAATGAFKFKTVPSPRPSAARSAVFKVGDGSPDDNSAPVDALHDGKLPGEEDEPDANFFFQEGSNGGQVMMDLGKVIPIKEVDTYSWHSNTRAPQVYKLYGRETADDKSEWKLIAEVDTRKQFGNAGGQYGVKVDAGAGIVGRYRYLNFFMVRTEDDDTFGNTFYSEIDVVDGDAPAAAPTTPSASNGTSNYDRQGVHLTFTDDSAGFDPREKERLVNTFYAVYPRMAAAFNRNAPREVKIALETRYKGVAATEGHTIHCNPAWFREHPEDLDVITHEGMHVVQQYRQWDPGWVTEGIADYARAKFGVNNVAGGWTMPEYDSRQSYQNAYRVTARFFVWLEKHVKPGIVVALDQSMREGRYAPEFWTQQTGKNVDELWQNYGKNPVL